MLMSLENMCRKLLCIDENVSVIDIANFLEKNYISNLDSLFLINFKDKKPISLNSRAVRKNHTHKILGFEEMSGRYGKYYFIYCRINCGEKYEYEIFISNKKLTKEIDYYIHEELDLGISSFIKKHYGYKKIETFNLDKKELEKSKNIVKLGGDFCEKLFGRNYIYFYPRELNYYKGITYREIDIII